ncbi:ECF transporter S component [Anaerotruncus rubiinfantis]|uniref:ECF transporter S component n=1 Tax=Anaerotruncus rubiinfantis TaxID=1720200 RepID=UPI0011CBAEDC|nr:ECF transporter S component [Anaerotruncus rubiinfantis]
MSTTRKTTKFTQLSLLIALMAVLAFTPLGFIMIPPVAITIMHIPVIIGAILLGPVDGAILGGAFGLMSLLKASTTAVSPVDLLFSPFASGAPFASLVMCILPRILLGVIAGCLYRLLRRTGRETFAIATSAAIASICHTVLVLGCLWALFDAIPLKDVFLTIVGFNGILELSAAVVVTTAVCRPLMKFLAAQGALREAKA